MTGEWLITRYDLTAAIEREHLTVMDDAYGQPLRELDPAAAARRILARVDAMADGGDKPEPSRVHSGNAVDEARERCRAALSWCSPENRRQVVSELISGEFLGLEDDVVDAHVCCEHADGQPEPLSHDPEIRVMATVGDALSTLDRRQVRRVLAWAADKYDHEPPF